MVLLYIRNVGFFPPFRHPYGASSDNFIGENVVDVGSNDVLLNSTSNPNPSVSTVPPFISFFIPKPASSSSELLLLFTSIFILSLESITSIGL